MCCLRCCGADMSEFEEEVENDTGEMKIKNDDDKSEGVTTR